ncbi:hypothetical protein B296_00000100, partial [Ensete ventricosum]
SSQQTLVLRFEAYLDSISISFGSSHPWTRTEMYADQISAGRKRSIKERLYGDLGGDVGRPSVVAAKRCDLLNRSKKEDIIGLGVQIVVCRLSYKRLS